MIGIRLALSKVRENEYKFNSVRGVYRAASLITISEIYGINVEEVYCMYVRAEEEDAHANKYQRNSKVV